MTQKRVAKHGGCLQLLGVVMMIPGIACLLLAVVFFVSGISATATTDPTDPSAGAGAAIGGISAFGFLFIGAPSLAIGLILGAAKKIWKCSNCGSFVERL